MSGRGVISCDEARELAPAYVLGALDGLEVMAVRQHLATCDRPHPEFAELGGVVPYLAESPDPVEPPGRLRQRILEKAAREARREPTGLFPHRSPVGSAAQDLSVPLETAPPVPRWRLGTGLSGRPRGVLGWRGRDLRAVTAAAASIVLLVALGWWNTTLQQDLGAARSRGDQLAAVLRAAVGSGAAPFALNGSPLNGSPSPSAARGLAVIPNGRLFLVVDGLPPAPAGRTYEAWLIAAGTPRPAGTFGVGADGFGILAGPATSGPVEMVAVTQEAAGGSSAPTGPVLLVGRIGS